MNTLETAKTFKLDFAALQFSGMCFTQWENGQICICDEIIVELDLTFTANDENDVFLVESYGELFKEVHFSIDVIVYGRDTKLHLNREKTIEFVSEFFSVDSLTAAARIDGGYGLDGEMWMTNMKNFKLTKLNK